MNQQHARLGRQEAANLVIEAADTPMHMGVLMLLDGRPLLDAAGRLDLAAVRRGVEARMPALPELRQVARPGPLPGLRQRWVEDTTFTAANHVLVRSVPPPGGEAELMEVVEALVAQRLRRSRPLWEMWFLTGLARHRLAVLLKVHHAVTDGLGLLRIACVLLDEAPRALGEAAPPPAPPTAPPPGPGTALLGRAGLVLHPAALARGVLGAGSTLLAGAAAGGRRRVSELNRPIGPGRRLAVVRLRLDAVRDLAHARSVTVNDVLLELVASGVESVLRSRGDRVPGRALNVLLAVNPRHPATRGRNQAGSVLVSLPLGLRGGAARLTAVAEATDRARRRQRYRVVEGLLVLGVLAHVGRWISRRQTVVQVAVSNLVGPAQPLYLFGCRLEDAIPITPISGSVTLDFCALSYAGRFDISLLADAASWPDLDLLRGEVESAWAELAGAGAGEARPA